jgi:hypothetical protein
MDATTVTAVVGLLLSSGLVALRVYEFFFARPLLTMHFKWVGRPPRRRLTWVIANVGRKKVIINEVRFLSATDANEGGSVWSQPPDDDRHNIIIIPTVLEADDASYTAWIPEALHETDLPTLDARLRRGEITRAVVETFERGGVRLWPFDVPPRPA